MPVSVNAEILSIPLQKGLCMSKVNIKQIAEIAGVSPSAVSLVLNDRKGVGVKTRKRILQVISDLNYTPNAHSRKLILQRSFNIFLVLHDDTAVLENTFYTAILRSVVQKASELGYDVILSLASRSPADSSIYKAIEQKNLDGILFLRDIRSDLRHHLQSRDIPFVVIDSHRTPPGYPCVRSDYELSAFEAVQYLISMGHRKVGLIGMGIIPEFYLASFNGFKRAMEETRLDIRLNWIQSEAYDEESAYACMEKILRSDVLPTAIYCSGDLLAIGAMRCAADSGYSVPDDFSFCGLDDIPLSRYCSPPLTTICVDKVQMGELAVMLLDKMIRRQEDVSEIVTVRSSEIRVRGSVRDVLIQ